jgi:hypothetical protein
MNRRRRKRRERARARRAAERLRNTEPDAVPGRASDYIDPLGKLLTQYPDKPVVLLCRASTPNQDKPRQCGTRSNLSDQILDAIHELRGVGVKPGLGGRLVAIVEGVESSSIDAERPLLQLAIRETQRQNGILATPSRDRLIRGRHYDGRNATEAPTDEEYEQLMRILVATIGVATGTAVSPFVIMALAAFSWRIIGKIVGLPNPLFTIMLPPRLSELPNKVA